MGSYVGNRADADEALAIAAGGHVKTSFVVKPLSELVNVFSAMKEGKMVSDDHRRRSRCGWLDGEEADEAHFVSLDWENRCQLV